VTKPGFKEQLAFVLALFVLKTLINVGLVTYRKGSIVNVTTYVTTINYRELPRPTTPPVGARPTLSAQWGPIRKGHLSTTTPAATDFESSDCVRSRKFFELWRFRSHILKF